MATIHIERRRVKRKLAPPSFYYYLVTRENGRRKRTYVPLLRVLDVMEMLEKRKVEKQNKKERSAKDSSGSFGKRFYFEPLRHIMQSAGYQLQGARMHICWNKFLTKAAASVRFSMLDPKYQAAVGSSKNLLMLNRKAYSLLKRRNSYGIKTSYLECMSEVCTLEQSTVTPAVS